MYKIIQHIHRFKHQVSNEIKTMSMEQSTPKINTTKLLNQLFKTSNLDRFIQRNSKEIDLPPFNVYISALCKEQGLIPEHIIKKSDIERSFGHQIFKGTRKPSRDTVLQLAFGLEANLGLTQNLLKYARCSPLYPRIKRDAAIIYCIHNKYNIVDTQTILHELNLSLIGSERRKG